MLTNLYTTNNQVAPLLTNKRGKYMVAVYARVSPKGTGKKDKEETSLDIQSTDMLEELHNKKDEWRLFDEYSETVSGGLSFENRPRGADLLRDARLGKFNLVLIWDNDRLGRDREGMAAQLFRHEMRKLGVQVYSLHQPQILKEPDKFIDEPYDDGQILMEKIQDWQSASTINKFCVRNMRGKEDRAKRGEPMTTPNYGLKLEIVKDENGEPIIRKDGRVVYKRVVNKDEKPYVIRAYMEYIFEGKSMNEIRDGFNKDKVPTKNGRHWERAMIQRILTNPVYYGALIYNRRYKRRNSLNGSTRCGVNPISKWIIVEPKDTKIEPIIEKSLFDKAQEVRKAKLKLGAVSVYNNFLFSGLAKCGICGNKMYSKKVETRYKRKTDGVLTKSLWPGYMCGRWARFRDTDKNYISEKDIKTLLIDDLKKYKDNPDVLSGYLAAVNTKRTNNLAKRLVIVNKNLTDAEMRYKRLLLLFEHGKIEEPKYDEAVAEIDLEVRGMKDEKGRLESELADEDKRKLGRKEFKRAVDTFEDIFNSGDIKCQKLFIRSLIDSIVIHRRKVEINYSL